MTSSAASFSLDHYFDALRRADLTPLSGRVVRVVGLIVESEGPSVPVGEVCAVIGAPDDPPLSVEVVGFREGRLLSVPLGRTAGIRPGSRIVARGALASLPAGNGLLGRVINAFGEPFDGLGPVRATTRVPLQRAAVNPMVREPVTEALGTGVRAIDALLTCGRGQRLGLFGGSGVGKSTLLGMMARGTAADVIVMALVGERGREVRMFLEQDLGPEGLARSVVVVSTSDMPPLVRMRAAYAATAIAEHFRDEGKNVLLLMDSITRFAMAQREVGLAAGEPPTAKGYPPSVFALLPSLLERAGNIQNRGSITGLYTVLVEGDDTNEPVADAVRAILDGHIVLSRDLAGRNHYPAIDILQSVSRTMPDVTEVKHRTDAGHLREWLAMLRDSEDLVSVGAYVPGSNARLDTALARRDSIQSLLCQPADTTCDYADSLAQLGGGDDRRAVTFRFRAAALLDLRRKQLEDARAQLARAQEKLANADRAVTSAVVTRDQAESQFHEALISGLDGDSSERHRNWITHQHRVVSLKREAREACQREVEREMAGMMDKRRQVRVLERLRERAWRRYEDEMRRREMKEIDLFATLQHARRISEGD